MNRRPLIPLASLSAMLLATCMPAQAGTSDACNAIVTWTPSSTYVECTAGPVPANKTYHYVHIKSSTGSSYRVRDLIANVDVARGSGGFAGANRTIFGLYGREYVVIAKAQGVVKASIDNY